MSNLEIIMAPYDVYWAPTGETFPDTDEAPSGNWAVLGVVGAKRQNEDGVMINSDQSFELFRPAGLAAPVEASRTEEDVIVSVTIHDLSMQQFRLALNTNTVTSVAAGSGTPGEEQISLERGAGKPNEFALLVRGPSPLFNGGNAHYELPRVFVRNGQEIQFSKNTASSIVLEFQALYDATLGLGTLAQQSAAALP